MDALYAFSPVNWMLIGISVFILGLAKAGLKGIEMLNVTIMALVFGGKASTGIVLPLLCVADVMAVIYYNRHAQWLHVRKLIPWMVLGVLIGMFLGKDLPEVIFRRMMAVIIVLIIALLLFLELRKDRKLPTNKLFAAAMGLVSGFATMIGNLAGAFANVYFLAMRMPKNNFIGTAAWVFLIINFFKLPLQVFYWNNITVDSLKTDLLLLPFLLLGFWAGVKLVAAIQDNRFRRLVFVLTFLGALVIFFK